MIALDIDGTILTKQKTLTNRTRKAIETAIAQNIAVALVTGRPLQGVPECLTAIRGLRYVITSNGAVTTDLTDWKILRLATLDSGTALDILEIPRKLDLVYTAFIDGIGYVEMEPFDRHIRMFQGTPIETYIRKSRRITFDLDAQIRSSENGVENIWFIAHDLNERDVLNGRIRERWNVRTVMTGRTDIEIGSAEADKGQAVTALASVLKIGREQVLAIGDSGNDLGMLRSAGISVAMGNADEEVKEIADIVTAGNDEDGAAIILEKVSAGPGRETKRI